MFSSIETNREIQRLMLTRLEDINLFGIRLSWLFVRATSLDWFLYFTWHRLILRHKLIVLLEAPLGASLRPLEIAL